MDVKAINNVSLLNFQGKSKKSEPKEIKEERTQMDSVVSKKGSKGLRSLMYGAMLLGAATGSTSCVKEHAWSYANTDADADAEVVVIGGNCGGKRDTTIIHDTVPIYVPDTIYVDKIDTIYQDRVDTIYNEVIKPVYVKEYPINLGDSLLEQGINIGVELDGPKPNGNDVVFVASKAYDRNRRRLYETKLDSMMTNADNLSLVTKVTDRKNPESPKVYWMRTLVTDVPDRGIKLDRYICNSEKEPGKKDQWMWKYSGSEIRSNGARGGNPGVNTVYDGDGNMIWQGEYSKRGQQALGEFIFDTVERNDDGTPAYDDDGNVLKMTYNFNQAKMWSDRIEYKKIPNSEFGKLD